MPLIQKSLSNMIDSQERFLNAIRAGFMSPSASHLTYYNTVGPAIIHAVPKNRAFEARFRISDRVCECVAMILAACLNMSKCCRSHGFKDWIYLELS
jgi:hypothetical protein